MGEGGSGFILMNNVLMDNDNVVNLQRLIKQIMP
jgi:hypothetical protein